MAAIDLAWDAGITDGDPGDGRMRANAPDVRQASHLLINDRDRHGNRLAAVLGDLRSGDVLNVTRPETSALIVAWVMGDVVHGGSYFKVPVSVRSVDGAYAAGDLIVMHRYAEGTTATEAGALVPVAEPAPPLAPAPVTLAPMSEPVRQAPIDEAALAEVLTGHRRRVEALEETVRALLARVKFLEETAIVDIEHNLGDAIEIGRAQ